MFGPRVQSDGLAAITSSNGVRMRRTSSLAIQIFASDLIHTINDLKCPAGDSCRFFVLFNWVCYDIYKREKFVKSGFKKWNTVWRDRAIEKFRKIKNSKKKKTSYPD